MCLSVDGSLSTANPLRLAVILLYSNDLTANRSGLAVVRIEILINYG
jgi:hypothetical protein